MQRHEITLVAITQDSESSQVQVDYTLDGQPNSKVFNSQGDLVGQNADLIQSPEEAARMMLFYFLSLVGGEVSALQSMVGKTLVHDVKATISSALAVV